MILEVEEKRIWNGENLCHSDCVSAMVVLVAINPISQLPGRSPSPRAL